MSVENVKAYLKQWGMDNKIMEFPVSSATVELASKALGVIPARIAKTLSFHLMDGCVLIVVAGDANVDNKKFKAEFGLKAKMLTPEEALAQTGFAVGGVCPFAIDNPNVKIVLDISLKRFETVFPACGSSHSAIELSCSQLYEYSRASAWVDVCKGWQAEEE